MKNLPILLFLLFAINSAIAQGCLPEGIEFHTQAQIDNFQTDNPGCTEIGGNVIIYGEGSDIANLNGLSALTGIIGNLSISSSLLIDLSGLDALSSIGGDLNIGFPSYWNGPPHTNLSLTSLTGLDGLTSIGGNLKILENRSLTTLSGLDNIDSIGGGISIIGNANLTECAIQGICDYFSNPNGIVVIIGNGSGCNTQSELARNCGGTSYCLPYGNYYFFSQDAIDNFPIYFSGCPDLGGMVTIMGLDITNLYGLNQVASIEGDLQIGMFSHSSGMGNPLLTDLAGLENLNYVGGDLWINQNDSLASLTGLENLTSIGGGLLIGYDYVIGDRTGMSSLASLNALGNLTSIGGELCVRGTAVTSLSGLDSLKSIGAGLILNANTNLADITSLINVTSGGGWISINGNKLTSLSGIDNLDSETINYLFIGNNYNLSTCEVQSICDYLASTGAWVDIENNAPGCNSREEVIAVCEGVSIGEQPLDEKITLSPNPFSTSTTIEYELQQLEKVSLNIYNHLGQLVYQTQENQSQGTQQLNWNAEKFSEGVYYYRLQVGDEVTKGKMLKLR